MHAPDVRHDRSDFLAFLLEKLQVITKNLERQGTLSASHRFSDVVFDGLGEVPDRARVLLQRTVHGTDQCFFVFAKYRAPLIMRLQVDEILGVAESSGVGSIIGAAYLRHHRFDLRKGSEYVAAVGAKLLAFRETCAVGQGAARPDGAL